MDNKDTSMDSGGKSILFIDDDITSLDIVSHLFERYGHQVARCVNGFEALGYLQKRVPDLILVDLLMPGMNGIATIQHIKEMGITTIPIIAFTAVADDELHAKALEAGCILVLTKPCPPQLLIDSINMAFDEEVSGDDG